MTPPEVQPLDRGAPEKHDKHWTRHVGGLSTLSEDRGVELACFLKHPDAPEPFQNDPLSPCPFPGCTIIMGTRTVAPRSLSPTAYLAQDFSLTKLMVWFPLTLFYTELDWIYDPSFWTGDSPKKSPEQPWQTMPPGQMEKFLFHLSTCDQLYAK